MLSAIKLATGKDAIGNVIDSEFVQPFTSVTVTVYVPLQRFEMVCVVKPSCVLNVIDQLTTEFPPLPVPESSPTRNCQVPFGF